MKNAEDIIRQPYITEKTNLLMGQGKYTFKVDKRATKTEIRLAVEKLFGVKVLSVNTMNYDGKKKRVGVHQGNRPSWKKAIVKIAVDPKQDSFLQKGGKETTTDKKYKSDIEIFGTAN